MNTYLHIILYYISNIKYRNIVVHVDENDELAQAHTIYQIFIQYELLAFYTFRTYINAAP